MKQRIPLYQVSITRFAILPVTGHFGLLCSESSDTITDNRLFIYTMNANTEFLI